ncbi:MAG: hypothetical protein ACLFTE_06535 [Salinivenus sp.]
MLQTLARWKKTILVVSAVLFVGLFLSRHLVGPEASGRSVGRIAAADAHQHAGARATVCGRVAEVEWLRDIEGEPTFVNLGGAHPEQSFTAVIWGDDRAGWDDPPAALYEGRSVCVTGTIEQHEGTPQIVVSSPRQVRVGASDTDEGPTDT